MSLDDLLQEPSQYPAREEVDALVREAMQCLPPARSDLSSRVSHAIRTPLAAILGFREVLQADTRVTEMEKKQYQEIITAETYRLKRFIESLKVFQALLAGELGIQRVTKDLRETIAQAAERCRYETRSKQIRIEVIRTAHEVPLHADHRRIMLAVEQLLLNAIRASSAEGIVDVEIVESKKNVSVIVEDSGYGMDPAQIDTMFKPFHRIPLPDDNGGELGIGLSIVRSIVERHEGSMKVETTPMEGARFTLIFPR